MVILMVLFIWWSSPQPVRAETQQVVVTGGTLQFMTVADDGLSGQISIDVPIECASIDWSARTTGGVYLHTVRTWRDGCYRFYIP